MSDDEAEAMQEAVHEHLSQALNPNGGVIITRWVLAVERFTADGKGVAFLTAPEMQPWEVIGMAEMASEVARLQITSEIVDEMYTIDDDDDD